MIGDRRSNCNKCRSTLGGERIKTGFIGAGKVGFTFGKYRGNSYRELNKAIFTIEGNAKYIEDMEEFIKKLGNKTQIIDTASKTKYHAAAVMVSNQVVALADIGIILLMNCGISENEAKLMLETLMLGNVGNIVKLGTKEALTGPVERNDIDTIRRHKECLSRRDLKIYVELSRVLLEIAKSKHTDKDYMELEKELENNEEYSIYNT